MTEMAISRRRVAIDAHVLTGKSQGSATFLRNILSQVKLMDLPFDIFLFSDDTTRLAALIGPSNFKYVKIPRCGSFKRLFSIFPRSFTRERIDLAVFQYIAPPFLHIPTVLVVHDILPITHPGLFAIKFRVPWEYLLRLSLKKAKVVISVSETGRKELSRRLPSEKYTSAICYNGSSFTKYPDGIGGTFISERIGDCEYILCVGRIEKRKNVQLLVDAFLSASPPGVKLVIVGKQDASFSWVPPQDDRIIHFEYLDDRDLEAAYVGASLFVYPSSAEGFGIPLLDSLTLGVPTISSDRTCMPEIAGKLARYFDPTASDAMGTLSNLIRTHFGEHRISPPSAEERSMLADRFNWHKSANSFVAALTTALAELEFHG